MGKNSEELASRLSYEVVKEVAPEELDLFDDFKEEFFKNPDAFLEKDSEKREEMLGFAELLAAEQFITAFVLPVVTSVVSNYLSKKIDESGKKYDSNQLKEFRDYAFNNAISLGMNEEKAGIMADSLMGKLSTIGL